MRTGGHAGATAQAARERKLDFLFGVQTFGVVTPEAAQRAAFEEYRGADARPIVDGETLDIEDQTAGHVGASH
jgi:hypothetical protein